MISMKVHQAWTPERSPVRTGFLALVSDENVIISQEGFWSRSSVEITLSVLALSLIC